MKAILIALMVVQNQVPTQKYPIILSGKIVEYTGNKFLCGLAFLTDKRTGRYIINMEYDWQIWEPKETDITWDAWDRTFKTYCLQIATK